ncbi:single-stranded DNA-binding protein, partial [Vitellibacter sp. q18]|nr:single-stranded DNA-binding protein [Aequorivita lutea]
TEILVETYQQMEFLPKEQPVKQSNLQNRLADDDPFASISRPINFNDEDLPF